MEREPIGFAGKATAVLEDVLLLDVSGMHCGSCSGRVQRLLEAAPYVSAATVSLATETALVTISIPPPHCSPAGKAGKCACVSRTALQGLKLPWPIF